MSAPLVVLSTDFGVGSTYVAQVKGVLLSACVELRIVDATHALPAFSVRHAEVHLRGVAFAFPLGTVHMVIVDPGVGTQRRPVAVQSRGMFFVGPDNGVLGQVSQAPGAQTVVLDRTELFCHPVAPTFHARDVFAPVAVELASGLPLGEVGSPISDAQSSTLPSIFATSAEVCGETLTADVYGNLTTNIPAQAIAEDWHVFVEQHKTRRVATYGYAQPSELLALVGSDGYLEIAVRNGSAQQRLGASEGLRVVCRKVA